MPKLLAAAAMNWATMRQYGPVPRSMDSPGFRKTTRAAGWDATGPATGNKTAHAQASKAVLRFSRNAPRLRDARHRGVRPAPSDSFWFCFNPFIGLPFGLTGV